ncbi:hypothetical protein GCM10017687_83460 [Streptomyces echinatus]
MRAPRDPAEIAHLYAAYEDLKRDRAVIDFEDVLLLTGRRPPDRHDIADQVRRSTSHFVRGRVPGRQPAAARLLDLVARRPGQPVRRRGRQPDHLFVHGLATPDHLLDFRARHPGATS